MLFCISFNTIAAILAAFLYSTSWHVTCDSSSSHMVTVTGVMFTSIQILVPCEVHCAAQCG
jgi:hypothetical protein